jgi:hypothetical protein
VPKGQVRTDLRLWLQAILAEFAVREWGCSNEIKNASGGRRSSTSHERGASGEESKPPALAGLGSKGSNRRTSAGGQVTADRQKTGKRSGKRTITDEAYPRSQ